MRRIGGDGRRLWRALRDVFAAVLVEAAVTLATLAALRRVELDPALAATGAALTGLLSAGAALVFVPSKPLAEAQELLVRALRGEGTS